MAEQNRRVTTSEGIVVDITPDGRVIDVKSGRTINVKGTREVRKVLPNHYITGNNYDGPAAYATEGGTLVNLKTGNTATLSKTKPTSSTKPTPAPKKSPASGSLFGPGSNEGAYDYSPFPGTSTRQQQNLKDYDKKYGAAAEKLRKQGYVVNGDSYFKRMPDSSKPGGYRLQKVGKVNTGHNNEALKVTTPKVQKPTAPAKPAEMPVVTGPNGEVLKPDTNNPGFMVTPDGKSVRGDLTGGKGPISEDTDTGYPTLPTPTPTPTPAPTEDGGAGGGSGGSEPRTSVTGLNQYGKTLGGLNQFTKAFTDGYEVEDISKAFKSESLPTTENYSWNAKDNNGGYLEEGTWSEETNRIEPPSVPGTLGGNPDNPQDGTSAKPSVADKVRAIRVGRQSGLDGSDNDYPDDDSLVSPMYANERRNKIRRAFLDHEGSSVQAIAAANAVAGYGKNSDGNARFNVGGKLVGAKKGMEYKARNAAMSGENPMQYLDIPSTPDTQPDTPADSELSPEAKAAVSLTEAPMNFKDPDERAMSFAQTYIDKYKNK